MMNEPENMEKTRSMSPILAERVEKLEAKIVEQQEEILILKTNLLEIQKRLSSVEFRYSGSSNGVMRSKLHGDQSRNIFSPKSRKPGSPYTNGSVQKNLNSSRSRGHHQSTGSLHSIDSQSSNGLSPSPSPSPYNRKSPSPRSAKQGAVDSANVVTTPSPLAKRWSSTSDFHSSNGSHVGFTSNSALSSTRGNVTVRSLLNLHVRSPHTRHGTKDATYNGEEGSVRMFLRGRPVNLYLPNVLADNYSLARVSTAPLAKLRLEWIYGYRGRDCRSNLFYMPTGELIYFIAAVVVMYNVDEQIQRHYMGHTDDVKCLAIHPNKLVVASGQCSGHDKKDGKAHVRIWNSVSLHTLHVLGLGELERSICCLSFSKADGGALLCVIDEGNEHTMSIWDWQRGERGQKLVESKCSSDTVVTAEFHPLDRNSLITCGKQHIAFWTFENNCLYKKLGVFDHREKPRFVTCLAFTATGDIVSGDSSGNLIVWARGTNVVAKSIRNAHEGPIFFIHVLKDGEILTGGGKDGRIVQWDSFLTKPDLETIVPEQYGSVRTIAEGRGYQLYIGTTKNCIVAGSFQMPFQLVAHGHTDELWALDAHPEQQQFVTGGHDRTLVLWDSLTRSPIWSYELEDAVQSACFSPDGSIIAVGTTCGHWFVLSAETREILSRHTDGTEAIQVIRYSPDGKMLAVGSRDNVIYIYQTTESFHKYFRIGRCTGHSSFITHMDWSCDSTFIRSNSGDYEVLLWNATVCRQIPQTSQLRDTEWHSATSTLSPCSIGIWPENADGTDVNSCDRSNDGKLLVTGDDFGKVKLFSFPVVQPKALCHQFSGHSSHVTNVQFLQDDTRIISIGGKDSSIIQWVVC